MLKLRALSCAVGLLAGLTSLMPSALAQGQAIDVRTGLWEIATDRTMSGVPRVPNMPAMPAIPPEVLAKMTPAQRAQIESAMRNARGAAGPKAAKGVKKICITRETLQRDPSLGMENRPGCRRTVNARTTRSWELQEICNQGGNRQTMHVRYEAANRETITGAVNIVMSDGGREMKMNQVMRGRWLGPDCGSVKPK